MDRRSRTWRQLTASPGPAEDGHEPEVIDGIVFTYEGETRCKVCGAADAKGLEDGQEVRATVDRMLVEGATYARILRAIEPLVEAWPAPRRPSYDSIRRHQVRHLPADAAAVREIVERRALDQGLRIAVGAGPIVTRAAILELVRDRGFAALAAGDLIPSLGDTLHAAEVLEELDRQVGSTVTLGELAREVRAFVDIVRSRIPQDAWDDIVREMETGPAAGPALPPPETEGGRADG